ncbi:MULTISPECIES: alpha/beta fold hydrolase [unclassified Duganella]|uniref:alpha/beta fold hydrolase n=1 Tax=unclassified Duganella TaxID=2636909 RepID=UPI00088C5BC6|nr:MULTISPECIES: alpha/beta hydrolase [unclassified Duganella]SDG18380.1 Pimeloyl-ACP methyl ester carboxylesterase [Duganella sp. OV458]SDJ29636.1 Pimeloyl-ACP methyl ester carboxylesterase [Duganella sp. OV510]
MSNWVLLRGLMREQRHWGRFPGELAHVLPEANIITTDLPGNGEHHAQRSPTTVAAMVEFCRADLRARGVPAPWSLLALSLGGMVAVEWASRYPQEIERCVLINTSMRPYSRFHQRLRWQNYPAIIKQMWDGGVENQERLILRLTSREGDIERRNGMLERWLSYQREYPVTRANALRQLWSAAGFRAPATRPPVPLLVLSSAGDQLVDPRCSANLARAWKTDHAIHPSAGHDLPLDAGAWVASEIGKWLSKAR